MRPTRGYTIVELLMALAIFGVGVTGVVALQKVTGASNQHARNLAIATHVAQSWIEQLAADATSWTNQDTHPVNMPETVWLNQVRNTGGTWFRPATDDDLHFGARFGALGQPLADDATTATVFCAHLRLTMLNDPAGISPNGLPLVPHNGLIRAEVRVLWPRHAHSAGSDYCGEGEALSVQPEDLQNYHFVYQTTALRQSIL